MCVPVPFLDKEGYVSSNFNSPKAFKQIENWIKTILSSNKIVRLKFGQCSQGGVTKNGEIILDDVFKNNDQRMFFYWPESSFFQRKSAEYYKGPEVLAHELLGHAYDWIQGKAGDTFLLPKELKEKFESNAIQKANIVHDLLGYPRRSQ